MSTDRSISLWRRAGLPAGSRLHPLLQAVVIVSPLALLLLVGSGAYFSFSHTPPAAPRPADAGEQRNAIETHRLGSILFVPWTGANTCEERRFDNLTGRILFDGLVECEFVTPQEDGTPVRQTADSVDKSARMRAILEGFKK